MKVLVTGATGLVGKHLVNHLLERGYEVVGLGRNQLELNLLDEQGASTLAFDLTNPDDYSKLDVYREYIWVHVAAAISGAKREVLDMVNIEGTKMLVAKANELGITRFVLVSSISTYSINLHGKINTSAEQNPESYYGQTKLAQEQIVKGSGLAYTIIRPPYIGGPNDVNFLEEFTSRIEKSKMPSFSKIGRISYVDARDLANAIRLVLEHDGTVGKSYNIVSEVKTHDEVVEEIAKQIGKSPPFGPHYSYPIAMFVGLLGEIWAKLQGKTSDRSISRYRIRTLCRQFELDPSNLVVDTGYQPQYTIAKSIQDWLPTRHSAE